MFTKNKNKSHPTRNGLRSGLNSYFVTYFLSPLAHTYYIIFDFFCWSKHLVPRHVKKSFLLGDSRVVKKWFFTTWAFCHDSCFYFVYLLLIIHDSQKNPNYVSITEKKRWKKDFVFSIVVKRILFSTIGKNTVHRTEKLINRWKKNSFFNGLSWYLCCSDYCIDKGIHRTQPTEQKRRWTKYVS